MAAYYTARARSTLSTGTHETGKQTTVTRHREIDNITAREICKQLEIPLP